MKFLKTNAVLILMVFLIAVIAACNQNPSSTIAETEELEEKEGIAETPPAEAPQKSKQEILAENVKAQSSTAQKNNAPTIQITEPDDGESVTGDQFTVWWNAKDANSDILLIKLEYKKEGKWVLIADNEPNDRSFIWDIGTLDDGVYQIRATVTDGRASASDTKSFSILR